MMLGANSALSPVVTFMTLQFTLMARECFDALQNWSDEHSYVKVILAGRSSGEITDEEAAQKVLAEYFEKNPDHLARRPSPRRHTRATRSPLICL